MIQSLVLTCALGLSLQDAALDDLTGNYYFGDGTGVNCTLDVQKGGRFAFKWRGCLGTYDENQGAARLADGILILAPEKPNLRDGFRGTPTEFLPVRWGERRYLIPKEGILRFCNEINQGEEPRNQAHGYFYMRTDDWKKKAEGAPGLPQEWTRFLLKAPIRGELQELQAERRAMLNLGSRDGVFKGMILTGRDGSTFCQVEVVAVEDDRCTVTPRYKDDALTKGMKVTSLFRGD